MSRPGVAKVLDPLVASLLAFGDETIPAVPPSLTHLHTVLRVMVEHAADVIPDSDSDSGIVSDPEECLAQEERLEQRVSMLKRKEGLSTDRTLKQAFKLMDCLIGQYKLNRTDEILEELQSVCEERGGDWKVKYIQSTGFVRWKQYRFREALELFLEQQKIVGASAALCENIGHTYSSLGDLPKAEEYFERALELLKRGSYGNRGGIYMGLGLVRDRLGKTREALPILEQSLEHYLKEHTKDHVQLDSSIIAKAHMSVGKAHEKLGEKKKAASHMADALAIFRRTVGYDSPLTANAMSSLGKVKVELGFVKEGLHLLKGALKLEIAKDAFHLETVWELFSRVKDVHMEQAKERQAGSKAGGSPLDALRATYSQYIPLVQDARKRLGPKHEREELGTLAVFYKTVGEMFMLAQDYVGGEVLINEALRCFRKIKDFDCTGLIEGCDMLLGIAHSNVPKQKPATSGKSAAPASGPPPPFPSSGASSAGAASSSSPG